MTAVEIRGVIFDMDGVLCDSEALLCQAARQMFRDRYGLDVPPEDFLPFVGTGEGRYLGGVAEKYGKTITLPDDKIHTYTLYLDIIRGRLQPLPGVREFIAACRDAGRKIAVASAADLMKVDGNLAEIGLPHETFDAVITGNDVTKHKPDPQCFLLAAERLTLPPEQCLVVEDANNGCRAARTAGMRCLGITSSFPAEQLRQAGADWTAPDLAHVPPELS